MKLFDKGENRLDEIAINNLIVKAKNNDEQAIDELFSIFKPKVNAISREYFLIGADSDDLIQEGMIGLYKAINVYDAEKNHNFSAFASLCIHRQLQNAVKNANRKKNSPLNSYVPIKYYDGSTESEDENIIRLVIVDDTSDIEQNFVNKESNAILLSKVKNVLNDLQFTVLKKFINGESYSSIAESVDLTTKNVDNMLQAIKKKLKTLKGEL